MYNFFNTSRVWLQQESQLHEEHLCLYICVSACSAWMAAQLCQESSPSVNFKSGAAILSCPCLSLFKGKTGANRTIPKADRRQSHLSLNLRV